MANGSDPIRVTVWGENRHEQINQRVREVYPDGLHEAIASGIRELLGEQAAVRTATLDEPDHGLADDVLATTDVLTWWGHMAHHEVADAVVKQIHARVLAGMGLIAFHSSIHSKIFLRLMGTSCNIRWREADDRQLVWTLNPSHPIASGIPHPVVIPKDEMYGEFFDIPTPDELVFVSSFSGGEVFRSGCCFTRGNGRVFYFSPGHETFAVYDQPEVRQVIANAVTWAYNPRPSEAVMTSSPASPVGWFEDVATRV
jgi:trehalose utilization protein